MMEDVDNFAGHEDIETRWQQKTEPSFVLIVSFQSCHLCLCAHFVSKKKMQITNRCCCGISTRTYQALSASHCMLRGAGRHTHNLHTPIPTLTPTRTQRSQVGAITMTMRNVCQTEIRYPWLGTLQAPTPHVWSCLTFFWDLWWVPIVFSQGFATVDPATFAGATQRKHSPGTRDVAVQLYDLCVSLMVCLYRHWETLQAPSSLQARKYRGGFVVYPSGLWVMDTCGCLMMFGLWSQGLSCLPSICKMPLANWSEHVLFRLGKLKKGTLGPYSCCILRRGWDAWIADESSHPWIVFLHFDLQDPTRSHTQNRGRCKYITSLKHLHEGACSMFYPDMYTLMLMNKSS